MENVAPALVGIAMFMLIGFIVRNRQENGRVLKLTAMQAELQGKLLEKVSSADEMRAYLDSEAGRTFVEAAPLEKRNPYGRILGSIQAGIILALLGVAFLYLERYFPSEPEGFVFLGSMALALGVGFLISAIVAYMLSKAWGLINGGANS